MRFSHSSLCSSGSRGLGSGLQSSGGERRVHGSKRVVEAGQEGFCLRLYIAAVA
jgi:hypothetical protein